MYAGCPVEIQMIKPFLSEAELEDTVYPCETVEYREDEEELHLMLMEAALPSISLDAEYECKIWSEKEVLVCQGRVRERYIDKNGNNLIFQIENGFYKNNLN